MGILSFLLPSIGKVLETAIKTYQEFLKREESKEVALAKAKEEAIKHLALIESEINKEASSIIKKELSGENWLQRNWRPLVAVTSFFSYWFVIIPYPFLVEYGVLPQVRFGEKGLENMFWLTVVAVGGYIGARSVEKIYKFWRA